MGMTITEKILAGHAGKKDVHPGELIDCRLDFLMGNDITAPLAIREFERVGATEIFDPDRNLGLPLFETADASRIEPGDDLELNPATGEIRNLTRNETYRANPLPPFAREIMAAGGLMTYVAKKKGRAGRPA